MVKYVLIFSFDMYVVSPGMNINWDDLSRRKFGSFLLIALNIPITFNDAQPLLYSNRHNSHCGLNLHYLYRTLCVWCPLESCLWGPTINMLNLQQPDKKINKKVTYRFMCKDFYATIIHKKQNLRNNLNFNQIEE